MLCLDFIFQQLGWLVLLLSHHRHGACKISMVVIVWYWKNRTWIRWTPRNTGWTLEIRHAPWPSLAHWSMRIKASQCPEIVLELNVNSQEPCETDLQWVRPMRGSICNMQKNGLFTEGLSWNLSCFVQKWGIRMYSIYPKMTMKKRLGISGKLD